MNEEVRTESEIVVASNEESNFLSDSGFKIAEDQYVAFVDSTIDIDLKELVTKLKGIQEEIAQEDVDLDAFSKIMLEKVSVINAILESDAHVKDVYGYYEFKSALESIENKFSAANNYYRALKIENDRELVIRDINKQLYDLKNDQNLSASEKAAKAIALRNGLIAAKAAKKEAVEFRALQESEYSKANEGKEIINLKNDLLSSVNELDKMYRNLDPRPLCADSLGEAIRGTRDEIVMFGLAAVQKQREFDSLCEKYHLVYDESLDKKMDNNIELKAGKEELESEPTEIQEQADTPVVEEPVETHDDSMTPVTEEKTESEIKDEKDLFESLKKLNPDANITLVDGLISASVDLKDLKLPEGFKYTEGIGINNKVSDTEEIIALGVKSEHNRESTHESVEEVKDEQTVGIAQKLDEVRNSTVESKGHKVVKVRQAIIAPYISSVLKFGGVAALSGVALAGALVVPALAGGAIGAIAQTLHNKLGVEGHLSNVKGFESNPEEMGVTFKSLLEGYKNKRKAARNAETQSVPEPVESPAPIPEYVPIDDQENSEVLSKPVVPAEPVETGTPEVVDSSVALAGLPSGQMIAEDAYRDQIGEQLAEEPFDFTDELGAELGGR